MAGLDFIICSLVQSRLTRYGLFGCCGPKSWIGQELWSIFAYFPCILIDIETRASIKIEINRHGYKTLKVLLRHD